MTTPRLTAMGVNKNGAAPDANAVWNKNRRRCLAFTVNGLSNCLQLLRPLNQSV
jgi:hypothetical protein